MLEDYAEKNVFTGIRHFTDNGISGTTFEREGLRTIQEKSGAWASKRETTAKKAPLERQHGNRGFPYGCNNYDKSFIKSARYDVSYEKGVLILQHGKITVDEINKIFP